MWPFKKKQKAETPAFIVNPPIAAIVMAVTEANRIQIEHRCSAEKMLLVNRCISDAAKKGESGTCVALFSDAERHEVNFRSRKVVVNFVVNILREHGYVVELNGYDKNIVSIYWNENEKNHV